MGYKILVADDESHIVHVLSMKLRNAGYTVMCAMDGEEALELCVSERPDVLITDNQMPYLSGMELSSKVHQMEAFTSLPTILLTARGYDLSEEELSAAGVAMVLAKPFSPREVLEHVKQLLGVGPSTTVSEAQTKSQ